MNRTGTWRWAGALVVGAALLSPASPASPAGDARSERERIRREQAAVAAELDVLQADNAQVTAALDALNANVAAEERALADARRQVAAAEQALAEAQAAEAATQDRITRLRADLRQLAVDSFMGGGQTSGVGEVLGAADPVTATRTDTILALVVGDADDLTDQLEAAEEDLRIAREGAEAAAAEARARQDEATQRLATVASARDEQAAFAAELDTRIEARLAESAALAQIDQRLAAQIAQQEAELARRRAQVAAAPRVAPRRSSVSSGGSSGSLVTVRGITVDASIADQLAAMLDAASADGISFGGGGYRDPSDQQRLRDQNCPSDDAPASSCRPPTARPGQSMHEQGLAIDFTYNGSLIQGRSNPGYRWLDANAASFGLYNLPSEAWHWSSNGN